MSFLSRPYDRAKKVSIFFRLKQFSNLCNSVHNFKIELFLSILHGWFENGAIFKQERIAEKKTRRSLEVKYLDFKTILLKCFCEYFW